MNFLSFPKVPIVKKTRPRQPRIMMKSMIRLVSTFNHLNPTLIHNSYNNIYYIYKSFTLNFQLSKVLGKVI